MDIGDHFIGDEAGHGLVAVCPFVLSDQLLDGHGNHGEVGLVLDEKVDIHQRQPVSGQQGV